VEKVVMSRYHEEGTPGRPPRNPLGLFKAQVVKRLESIPSDRALVRRLKSDSNLRRVCEIKENEKPYSRNVFSEFRKRVGPEELQGMMDHAVKELLKVKAIKGEKIVFDTTFVKAYSKRDPDNNQIGYSDPDARVGKVGKGKELGYKAHIALDAKSELPIAFVVVPANENEKKHAPTLLKKSLRFVHPEKLVADSQYS
jgi:IS5 family transposase